jgi:septal ring factor EnvC (AmiA/AmiB activator)
LLRFSFYDLERCALAIYSGTSSVPLDAHQEQQNWINENLPILLNLRNYNQEQIENIEEQIKALEREDGRLGSQISWIENDLLEIEKHSH